MSFINAGATVIIAGIVSFTAVEIFAPPKPDSPPPAVNEVAQAQNDAKVSQIRAQADLAAEKIAVQTQKLQADADAYRKKLGLTSAAGPTAAGFGTAAVTWGCQPVHICAGWVRCGDN